MYSDSQDEWHRKSEQDYTKHRQKSRNVLRNDFSKTFYIHASVPAKNNIKELPVKGGASVLGCGEGVKGGGGGGQGRVYWWYRLEGQISDMANFTVFYPNPQP